MDVDKEKQARAMAKAKQSLLQAEIKREEARLNQAIALFLQEKFDIFLNDGFVQSLAPHILKLYRGDQRKTALVLLDKLEKSICDESIEIRERSLMVIMMLSEQVYLNNIRELSAVVARISAKWLYFESEFIAGFEAVCLKLQRIIVEMLSTQQWYEVEQLIVTMNKISNKNLRKTNLIHGVIARVHDKLAEPEVLDIMANAYLSESNQRKDVVENILINMGHQGTRFLVQKLAQSNDKDERLALVDLIPRIGKVSVPILISCLDEEQPWFVTRNIIMIVSRLGDDALYGEVKKHLAHQDIRVQQQVLNCIEVLGGDQMKDRLLEALQLIDDELKAHLVDLLVQFEEPEIEETLLSLFEQRENFSSHMHDFLISKLCNKLVAYPSSQTIQALLTLIEDRQERYGLDDSLVRTATDTLHKIEQNTSGDTISFQNIQENQVNSLIEDEVLAQIPADPADLSAAYSDEGFSNIFVETLTDTLTSNMEKTAVEEQTSSFESHLSQDHHLMVWSGFYERLNTEEANTIFKNLTPLTLKAGEYVVQQGDKLSDLIFIDHGFGEIITPENAGDLVFTPVQGGELLGSGGFFGNQPWPFTIQAQTDIQVRLLKKDQFSGIQEKVPGLRGKLSEFCSQYDVLPYLISGAMDNPDAPEASEITIHCPSAFKSQSGEDSDNEVSGNLTQTTHGGFNVIVSKANLDNLKACLGHQVSAELSFADGSLQTSFGIIVGGGIYKGFPDGLHLHIKLYHPLQEDGFNCSTIHIM
ncbi:MAG: cyclic nucleotide-binding domain-containing protein [Desulfofustis sp.]|nr:cyclic nucleotide-binding domain-containing protein [Desulfofustis sp.]